MQEFQIWVKGESTLHTAVVWDVAVKPGENAWRHLPNYKDEVAAEG